MDVTYFLEVKNEFTEHLVDTLTPFIYEGLTSIYKKAKEIAETNNEPTKTIITFQKSLQQINAWNQVIINDETNRIKQLSNTADYLDDLVKAVIKANIILLTYSNSISNIIGQTFYNTFTTTTFIHQCYIECGKDAHNNPILFYHDAGPMELKRNQLIITQNIQHGITRAIRKILPIGTILKEFLVNSMNIIQEPPKVELVPAGSNAKVVSESKLPSQLEKEVKKIIDNDHQKSDKQKIQAIINMDKIVTSMEPTKLAELSVKKSSAKPPFVSPQNNKNIVVAPVLAEEDDNVYNNLAKSDKAILNINFDDEQSVIFSEKNVSEISMSGYNKQNKPSANELMSSERIDLKKVPLIESYGQDGGDKKNTKFGKNNGKTDPVEKKKSKK
jgi:hypothetical protein